MPKRRCTTCQWGEFEMTNHTPPRPKPNRSGRCRYEFEGLANELFAKLPAACTSQSQCEDAIGSFTPHGIWAELGKSCPCWESRDAR